MPAAFKSCRACGEPVFVGAKRCPKCRAPVLWHAHFRLKAFPLLILALIAIIMVGVVLYGWPDQTASKARTVSEPPSLPQQASGALAPIPAPPTLPDNRSQPAPVARPRAAPGEASASAGQAVAALQQRNSEQVDAVSVRGVRIEPGMSADRLFELVSRRDLLGQTMEPDPLNPPNLQFVKYYRAENQEFKVELRKTSRDAPYRVTSIHIVHAGDRSSTKR